MSTAPRPVVCDRVRMQVSLLLDDELSQLERRMLDAHLALCAGCAAHARDVTTFTEQLRQAPLVPLECPITVQRRSRRVGIRIPIGAAAALAFAALGLGSMLGAKASSGVADPARPIEYATRAQLDYEQQLLDSLKIRSNVSLGSVVL